MSQTPHLPISASLRYLVIDEADRMVNQDHKGDIKEYVFPDLRRVLEGVRSAEAEAEDADDDVGDDDDDDDDDNDDDDDDDDNDSDSDNDLDSDNDNDDDDDDNSLGMTPHEIAAVLGTDVLEQDVIMMPSAEVLRRNGIQTGSGGGDGAGAGAGGSGSNGKKVKKHKVREISDEEFERGMKGRGWRARVGRWGGDDDDDNDDDDDEEEEEGADVFGIRGLGGGEVETVGMPDLSGGSGGMRKGRGRSDDHDVNKKSPSKRKKSKTSEKNVPPHANINTNTNNKRKSGIHRQTMIFSATLSPGPAMLSTETGKRQAATKKKNGKGKRGRKGKDETDGRGKGLIEVIMDMSGNQGKVKIVELSGTVGQVVENDVDNDVDNDNGRGGTGRDDGASKSVTSTTPSPRPVHVLPPGLTLLSLPVSTLHKDSILLSFLLTSPDRGTGGTIVFCNSILGAKRVGRTLEILGILGGEGNGKEKGKGKGKGGGVLHSGLNQVRDEIFWGRGRKGKERKGKERKGKERKGKGYACVPARSRSRPRRLRK